MLNKSHRSVVSTCVLIFTPYFKKTKNKNKIKTVFLKKKHLFFFFLQKKKKKKNTIWKNFFSHHYLWWLPTERGEGRWRRSPGTPNVPAFCWRPEVSRESTGPGTPAVWCSPAMVQRWILILKFFRANILMTILKKYFWSSH